MDGRWTALLMLIGLLGADRPALAAPQPIATNKTRFRIPFKIEPAALQRLNARELQLHVSKDGGATWELSQSLPPDSARFEYQAAGDGEYRFAVKTLDGRNQLHPPAGQYETGLVVVVDTLPPLLELSLQQLSPGKVQLTWNAADSHLDVSTLKIEYQQPGSQEWEPVEVAPKATGQIPWNVAQAGQVKVRGSIADTGTNVGRGQAQVQIFAVGDPAPKPKPARRVPIAGLDDGQEQAAVAQPIPDSEPKRVTSMPGAQLPGRPSFPPQASAEPGDYRGPIITPFSGPSGPASTVNSNGMNRPDITKDRWGPDPEPAITKTNPGPTHVTQPELAPRNSHRRIVNSRRFQVGYTIDDVGPSGVGAVELFITQDQGRKWWKYGDDPDRRSPFDVEVPQDGEYGFAIRVRSGVGLTNDPPLPGETPAIVVAVDQTPPTVELLSAQQGLGASSNRVQVRWRIADEHLASKPVAVYSSPTRTGPWEPVSGWQDDQGGFEWTVAANSPPQFYVRVMVRDVAGNTAKAESPQPILVDLSRPTARIVDVEAPQGAGPK
ncbi:MAG: hypothetical protein WCJ09_25805 [Planctomycetota bacterium]